MDMSPSTGVESSVDAIFEAGEGILACMEQTGNSE